MRASVRLDAVLVGDDAASWTAAGFAVADASTVVGSTSIVCCGDGRTTSWQLAAEGVDLPRDVDGIVTMSPAATPAVSGAEHPNCAVAIDHLVLRSPDLDRTTEALGSLGIECRRIREIPGSDPAVQQRFFRFGPVILELVGTTEPSGDGPASVWGFAFTVHDLDASVAHLGDACGPPKDAVQPGRRIATVRTRDLGISSPIALMTPDPRR
jgi:hypothetical protein